MGKLAKAVLDMRRATANPTEDHLRIEVANRMECGEYVWDEEIEAIAKGNGEAPNKEVFQFLRTMEEGFQIWLQLLGPFENPVDEQDYKVSFFGINALEFLTFDETAFNNLRNLIAYSPTPAHLMALLLLMQLRDRDVNKTLMKMEEKSFDWDSILAEAHFLIEDILKGSEDMD